jgi:hypothetical protein
VYLTLVPSKSNELVFFGFDLWFEMKSDLMKLRPISFHIDSVLVLNDK